MTLELSKIHSSFISPSNPSPIVIVKEGHEEAPASHTAAATSSSRIAYCFCGKYERPRTEKKIVLQRAIGGVPISIPNTGPNHRNSASEGDSPKESADS
ncbi:hypothetical protein CEXT_806221 [Caerostris extrusa]|uniref:Uncharacterized protein n=1 Tax=Caerostris extrusa TaxID=172846 RepID=A0AAV4MYV1_CAEEX|nr:hypothetical protein CEXT_806221 [Caerostris extrusa]